MRKMKFIAIAAAALSIAVLALAGCGNSGGGQQGGTSDTSSSAADASAAVAAVVAVSDQLPEGKTLIVGFDQEYPPYGFVGADGEFTGFDLELAQEVCARNGWTYMATPINWDTKLTELNAGVFTCIWNGFTMEEREDDYAFSAPYMDNSQIIMVKAESEIQTLADLAGKTVATQNDSSAWEVLAGDKAKRADVAATFKALELRPEYATAVTELDAGAIDALACDLSVAAYYMSQNPGIYRILDEHLSEEHYAVGVKKGNEALADQITATLQEMNADGTIQALCEKYAEYGISYENWVLK